MDPRGYYVLIKHAIITLLLDDVTLDEEGITNTRIDFFNHQNVLSSAWVEKTAVGHLLRLAAIFGVDGSFCCKHLSVKLKPGNPDGSPLEPSIE